ncbi:uncharacterized protein LOC143066474 [Mytilus galloprovincialis]|uniref:Uncharacterized protein n=1 Tax=Mytilus galloprovincialis TaxID=29158 RepID=A0A8B6CK64_MYTGA|nr:Hypothetical predicted protein [Mytilus galloprovincialis]
MDFLLDQVHRFLTRIGHRTDLGNTTLSTILDASYSDFNLESKLTADDYIEYTATALGLSTAAFMTVLCFRYILDKLPNANIPEIEDEPTEEKIIDQNLPMIQEPKHVRPTYKVRSILNLSSNELRNFENEAELESFYCWRESLPPQLVPDEIESDGSGEIEEEPEEPTNYTRNHEPTNYTRIEEPTNYTRNEEPTNYSRNEEPTNYTRNDVVQDDPSFDKLYRQHSYLPPFVKNHAAVERYTETLLAGLERDKDNLSIQYTPDSLTFNKLTRLLHNDVVPFDISPESVTEVVVRNKRLGNEELLDILCRIYDLCISNKIAEWSLHYRKSVQPYFRNRHYRKQFQTRPVNDLLQDIQNYYSNQDQS